MSALLREQTPSPGDAGVLVFAAVYFEHAHIQGQCDGLIAAGAVLKWAYDPDPAKLGAFLARYPGARPARSLDEILADPAVQLVTAAAVPDERSALGCRVMRAGKDYFTDKPGFTTLGQLAEAWAVGAETKRHYWIYFSERFQGGCVAQAGELVRRGAIGRVVQVLGLAPHRLGNKSARPSWFWNRRQSGGILCDIASHQFEQFLYFSGTPAARVTNAAVGNFGCPDSPGFEDFGEASLVADNGVSGYIRADWCTPAGLSTWGDGRTMILGTRGYIELRKTVDIARARTADNLYLVDDKGEQLLHPSEAERASRFGELIADCLQRTEKFMTQAHLFHASELALSAQLTARPLTRGTL